VADGVPGEGNVAIMLDEKELFLTPSLGACMAISKLNGGLNAAVQRCLALDMDTIVAVIVAGLGLNPTQAAKVPAAVYKTGLIRLHGACIDFISIVGNGGRPLSDEEEEPDDLDPPKPGSQ
jgi:hypothetical protein